MAIKKMVVLMSFSGAGGVERMMMNLIRQFAQSCECVELLVIKKQGPHFADIPDNVNIVSLNASHTLTAIPALIRYFKRNKPRAILVAKDRAGRAAIIAKLIAGVDTKIIVRLGTNLSTSLSHRSKISAWWRVAPMRALYKHVSQVVAVSRGVAEDTMNITGISSGDISVIRNPVVTSEFLEDSERPIPHDWLAEKTLPVIIGVGRLSIQKDFETLIKSVALVNRKKPCRLIILGEGSMRKQLDCLADSLGIGENLLMPGFQKWPGVWVKHSDCFVLSSRWEGSPNALTEALALGVPSVSTRCPSGPDETLDGGRFGPLVEVGDFEGMARAILEVLANPLPSRTLQSAVEEYSAVTSAQKYLQLIEEA